MPALFEALSAARRDGETTLSAGVQRCLLGAVMRARRGRGDVVRRRYGLTTCTAAELFGAAAPPNPYDATWNGATLAGERWALGILLFAAALYDINVSRWPWARSPGSGWPCRWPWPRAASCIWCARGRGLGAFRNRAASVFWRLARVRLAAEAFSYLMLCGIAGEPLKVVLLNDRVDPREATAAVALERLAYMIGTTIIVDIGPRSRSCCCRSPASGLVSSARS